MAAPFQGTLVYMTKSCIPLPPPYPGSCVAFSFRCQTVRFAFFKWQAKMGIGCVVSKERLHARRSAWSVALCICDAGARVLTEIDYISSVLTLCVFVSTNRNVFRFATLGLAVLLFTEINAYPVILSRSPVTERNIFSFALSVAVLTGGKKIGCSLYVRVL